ncbi:MAG: hypothetical protein Pars2KO_03440 [Parasphingorhabdus sp.]
MRPANYPKSIVWFERLYLGSLFLGIIQAALEWTTLSDELEFSSDMFGSGAEFTISIVLLALVVFVLVGLSFCLWYYIVRKPRVLAKWVFVVLSGFGVVATPFAILEVPPLDMLITIAITIMDAVAIFLLFRPDAKRWFVTSDRMDDKQQQALSDVFQ